MASAINRATQHLTRHLASQPLTFNYPISGAVFIQTVVTGDARNISTVSIINGTVMVWQGVMTQAVPTVTVPYNLVMGGLTIFAGTSFTMTIPTTLQNGNVTGNITMQDTGTQKITFTAQVATWPLQGSSDFALAD